MASLFKPAPWPRLKQSQLITLGMALAGAYVAADWIGSSGTWFKYTAPLGGDDTFAGYWSLAQARAEVAVAQAGLLPLEIRPFAGLNQLFPEIPTPTPVQAFVETLPLPDGPGLFIIEDATGSGKTEAAMTLGHRLMAAGRANGLYNALPTMATADMMYGRLSKTYRNFFNIDASPSLSLTHGQRKLNEAFRASIRQIGEVRNADGDESSAECASWLADGNRRAFLADVGIGTIDQALFAVLPVKFQSLRLWGLIDRVLIVDEAHAFDAYMCRELETLIEFQAALGGNTIILSATLPAATRQKFEAAYRIGIGAAQC
jgi:CRISPR-associated endonuclease/helicase Cas3